MQVHFRLVPCRGVRCAAELHAPVEEDHERRRVELDERRRQRLVVPRPAREVRHAQPEQHNGDGGGERAVLDAEADDVLCDDINLRGFGVADAFSELGVG